MIRTQLFACLLISVTCTLGNQLQAATFTQTLNYTATNQSMWGPGGSAAGFDFSDSISVSFPLGLGSASVGYSVAANSGTVSANFNGSMDVDYEDSIPTPGITSLNLGYAGTFPFPPLLCPGLFCIPETVGGKLKSNFGANAQLTSSLGNVGPDFTLATDSIDDPGDPDQFIAAYINENFVPQLGDTFNNSASAPGVVQLPVIDIFLGSAGVQLGVTQTNSFTATAIEGTLQYSLQGSGVINATPFSLGDLGANLDVDLTESGIWDFWFEDQTLVNSYSTAFDLDLDLFAETPLGCGTFGLSSCSESTNLTSFEVFMVDPFALAFNSITNLNGFSIEVGALPSAVPVPAAFWLFGTGLIGLIGFSKRRKAA